MWRLSVPLLVLLAAARGRSQVIDGGSNASGGVTGYVGPEQVDLMGELLYIDTHMGRFWTVRDVDGKLTPIAQGYQPPQRDDNGKDVVPGTVVVIPCYIDPSGTCIPVPGTITTILSATPIELPVKDPIYQRLLVVIFDYSACNMTATLTPAGAANIWLGPNGDGLGGVAQKFTQCSFGKLNLNATAFRAITVKRNCSTGIVQACSWWLISNEGDAAAKEQLGVNEFSTFTHFAYVVPPKMQSVCGWAGLALLPGKQIWLQTSSYGVNRWATIMQESIHNYGLWHSWRNGWEYEDYSTAMGRGEACPNAAETSRLGWSSPAAGGDAIDSSILTAPGVALTFNLPATYITGDGSYLRVKPDWLPGYGDSSLAKNLYIAVRVNKGGDVKLGLEFMNKVNIHEVNATMVSQFDQGSRFDPCDALTE
ncbi:hypothetical protein Vafri_8007 [Volvox africanus]|uniref:Peptidase M11 gametolysin domain-containing protein n=1 Tax=Volvox africanus TaxID=51714 RepID=A0A8J4B1W2_9CHLO|nr:hypothetical protein Vafri_8007 [Volvox africanus]